MTSLNEREKALEAEFKNREEQAFRRTVRRNHQFGLWVASRLGFEGEAAEAYAKTVVAADFEAPGDDDVIAKVLADLTAKGAAVAEPELRAALARAGAELR